jgi:uncharacterized protein (DUF4213/DUF364 family)
LTPHRPPTGIAVRYVAFAERIAARLRAPRVRALHLPPPDKPHAKETEFCALELEDGAIGFAFVRMGAIEARLRAGPHPHAYAGTEAVALARGFAAADPLAKALGFAALNALSQLLFARAGWLPPASGDSLGDIAPAPGEHIGMIGLFPPLVPQVVAAGARLTVLELKAELAGARDGYRVTLDPAELASCSKVVSTCTVMLNDTLDAVLAACRNARHIAVIGPTAGCIPDPLFERGVDAIGGRRVVDAAGFRAAFARGGKWGDHACKYVIAKRDYPGVDRLLERAG